MIWLMLAIVPGAVGVAVLLYGLVYLYVCWEYRPRRHPIDGNAFYGE